MIMVLCASTLDSVPLVQAVTVFISAWFVTYYTITSVSWLRKQQEARMRLLVNAK